MLVGFDATEDLRRSRTSPWVQRYKWPIYFFVAVAFWNMVGAGLFGFMINPPIALYYMQGLNTTPLHGHAALFGVYGMLGIGLMLVCLRVLIPGREWKDGLLNFSFWSLNGGLMAMCVLSLLVSRTHSTSTPFRGKVPSCIGDAPNNKLVITSRIVIGRCGVISWSSIPITPVLAFQNRANGCGGIARAVIVAFEFG